METRYSQDFNGDYMPMASDEINYHALNSLPYSCLVVSWKTISVPSMKSVTSKFWLNYGSSNSPIVLSKMSITFSYLIISGSSISSFIWSILFCPLSLLLLLLLSSGYFISFYLFHRLILLICASLFTSFPY